MSELLIGLIKLPFALLGFVLSLVFGLIGIIFSVLWAVFGGLWTVAAFSLAALLLVWLLAKLFEDTKPAVAR